MAPKPGGAKGLTLQFINVPLDIGGENIRKRKWIDNAKISLRILWTRA
jgi:hypothetical protein